MHALVWSCQCRGPGHAATPGGFPGVACVGVRLEC